MTNRAFSLVECKSFDDEARTLEGIATTPSPDRVLDVVEPLGGKFTLPLPLLLDHNHAQSVGHVTFAKATRDGIRFKATIAKIDEPGPLKDLCDSAWLSVRHKLRAAVSIGFRALPGGAERLDSGGTRFKLWEWLELSLCTIPAHAEALILSSKSIDATTMAALRTVDKGWNPPVETEPARKPHTVVRLDGTRPETPETPTDPRSVRLAELVVEIKRLSEIRKAKTAAIDADATLHCLDQNPDLQKRLYHESQAFSVKIDKLREERLQVELAAELEPQKPVTHSKSAAQPDGGSWENYSNHSLEAAKWPDAPKGIESDDASYQEALSKFEDVGISRTTNLFKEAGAAPADRVPYWAFGTMVGVLLGKVTFAEARADLLAERLAGLEQQFDAAAAPLKALADRIEGGDGRFLSYRGVWHPELAYKPGECTTWAGSLWLCDRATKAKPDAIGADKAWTLIVKKGRDGRDAGK